MKTSRSRSSRIGTTSWMATLALLMGTVACGPMEDGSHRLSPFAPSSRPGDGQRADPEWADPQRADPEWADPNGLTLNG